MANWISRHDPALASARFIAAALGRPVSLAEIGMADAETMGADVGLDFLARCLPRSIQPPSSGVT